MYRRVERILARDCRYSRVAGRNLLLRPQAADSCSPGRKLRFRPGDADRAGSVDAIDRRSRWEISPRAPLRTVPVCSGG